MELPIDNAINQVDSAYYIHQTKIGNELGLCVLTAARYFEVHPDYIWTIAQQEAGKTGEFSTNNDGTHDLGQMQINYEVWSKEFDRLGYVVDWTRVFNNLCDNVFVATKIIKMRQKGVSDAYTAMANYHWFYKAKYNRPHLKYKKHIVK
ncbi:transglycosylase SLT domain-containing protein, partial [Vibrio makurazakiensis]|uniref:transglycosylase SLT domain-containing protein n=1 Tax=Vibrio makurazakiensis TaxID=2910250 RepID=UPI003D0CCA61